MEYLLHDSQMVDRFHPDNFTMRIMWLPSPQKKRIEIRGNFSLCKSSQLSRGTQPHTPNNMSPRDLRLIGMMFPCKSGADSVHTK